MHAVEELAPAGPGAAATEVQHDRPGPVPAGPGAAPIEVQHDRPSPAPPRARRRPGQRRDGSSDPRYDWVPAGPFRAHLRDVSAVTGTPWPVLAVLARVSLPAARGLMVGRRGRVAPRICPEVAVRVFRLTSTRVIEARRRPVPALRTIRLLRRLDVDVDVDVLAARLDLRRDQLSVLLADQPPATCSELVAASVEAAYRQAWVRWCREAATSATPSAATSATTSAVAAALPVAA